MAKILLIYNDYFVDRVGIETQHLSEEGAHGVYHVHEDDAAIFIEQNGPFTEILFTKKVSEEHKNVFSKPPYNGKEMS